MKSRFIFLSIITLTIGIIFNKLILSVTLQSRTRHSFLFGNNMEMDLILYIAGIVLIILFFGLLSPIDNVSRILRRNRITVVLILIIGSVQFASTFFEVRDDICRWEQALNEEQIKGNSSSRNEKFSEIKRCNYGFMGITFDFRKFDKQVIEDLKDVLTGLIISLFFLSEMIILIFIMTDKFVSKSIIVNHVSIDFRLIRPVFFLLMFGIDFSISFIPLHMEYLYQPILGLSKDVILGLPVSLSVFFTGIGFFFSGIWNDKRGWNEPFLSGVTFAAMGNLYSWLAPDAFHFILAQCVVGFGYGLAFMAAQGFVMTFTHAKNKAQGFASLFAALYSGGFCGSSAGAMLAENIGYNKVFMISALIIFSVIACTLLLMGSAIENQKLKIKEKKNTKFRIRDILFFLTRRNVMAIILFSSIPANLAMVGFLNYFNPLYLSRMGVSQSDIGRTFMIYCAFAIYIGPFMSRHIDRCHSKKNYIIAGGITGSLVFFTYYIFDGFSQSIAAIFLLGFAHSFIYVAQAAYLLKLDITEKLGSGTAIAVYRLANRMGQVAGPLIFGSLITGASIVRGMVLIGCVYLILTLIFSLVAQKDKTLTENL